MLAKLFELLVTFCQVGFGSGSLRPHVAKAIMDAGVCSQVIEHCCSLRFAEAKTPLTLALFAWRLLVELEGAPVPAATDDEMIDFVTPLVRSIMSISISTDVSLDLSLSRAAEVAILASRRPRVAKMLMEECNTNQLAALVASRTSLASQDPLVAGRSAAFVLCLVRLCSAVSKRALSAEIALSFPTTSLGNIVVEALRSADAMSISQALRFVSELGSDRAEDIIQPVAMGLRVALTTATGSTYALSGPGKPAQNAEMIGASSAGAAVSGEDSSAQTAGTLPYGGTAYITPLSPGGASYTGRRSTPSKTLGAGTADCVADVSTDGIVSRLMHGLQLKDIKSSEVLAIYEAKFKDMQQRDSQQLLLLEAKTAAVAQADALIAEYRAKQDQMAKQFETLREMLEASEHRGEDASSRAESLAKDNDGLRALVAEAERTSRQSVDRARAAELEAVELAALKESHVSVRGLADQLRETVSSQRMALDERAAELRAATDAADVLNRRCNQLEAAMAEAEARALEHETQLEVVFRSPRVVTFASFCHASGVNTHRLLICYSQCLRCSAGHCAVTRNGVTRPSRYVRIWQYSCVSILTLFRTSLSGSPFDCSSCGSIG